MLYWPTIMYRENCSTNSSPCIMYVQYIESVYEVICTYSAYGYPYGSVRYVPGYGTGRTQYKLEAFKLFMTCNNGTATNTHGLHRALIVHFRPEHIANARRACL